MMLKYISFYIESYMRFPFIILHEISHWTFAVIGFFFLQNSFPTIHITRRFRIEEDKDNPSQTTTYGTCACINYSTHEKKPILVAITASAPIFLTLALFIFSPWWMYPIYLSNFSGLWISSGDYEQIKEGFKHI